MNKHNKTKNSELYLQPLKKIHLYSSSIIFDNLNISKGDIKYIMIFFPLALFILTIACQQATVFEPDIGSSAQESGVSSIIVPPPKDPPQSIYPYYCHIPGKYFVNSSIYYKARRSKGNYWDVWNAQGYSWAANAIQYPDPWNPDDYVIQRRGDWVEYRTTI